MGRFVLLASATLFIGLADTEKLKYGWALLGYTLLTLDLLLNKKKNSSTALSAGLLSQSFAWIFTGQWVMAGIIILLDALHSLSIRTNYLKLESKQILISFPWPRSISWDTIDFITLKDGMLTLEYRNGKVFQQLIEKDPSLCEADFNEFCQQQCKP